MQPACRRIPRKGSVAAHRRVKGVRRSRVRVVELFAREGMGERCEEGGLEKRLEWEDWVRRPRYGHRMEVGSPPSVSLSRTLLVEASRKMRGTRGTPR